MKKIIRIARVELSNQFYSPIAWLLLIIFIVQCGVTFSDTLQNKLAMQQMAKLFPGAPESVTNIVLVDQYRGLFSLILSKLYLYLPLLTMGLISREVSSGSIRLLYSSPVRTSQIVLGKFTAMVVYNLLLTAVLGVFAAAACMVIPHAEVGVALSGLFAVFLLLCTYAAIGLFMSCLTSYQVVAALSTLALFAALQYVGTVWQGVDFVRDITYFLSLGSRSQDMIDGLIASRDVLYFIIITAMFLGFAILKLKSQQEHRPLAVKIGRYSAVVVIALALGYVTSRPSATMYMDVTRDKTQTLSTPTQQVLKATGDEKVELTAYVNLLDLRYLHGGPTMRNKYLRTWEKYTRFKPIDYKFYYYYDTAASSASMFERSYKGKTVKDVATDMARMHKTSLEKFHAPEESRKLTFLKQEGARMVLELKYKGKTSMLRLFDDKETWPSEAQFVAAMKRLLTPTSIQKVGFLAGQLQRGWNEGGNRNYLLFSALTSNRESLINNGFDMVEIAENAPIPWDLAVLVIADPKVAFSPGRMESLRQYIFDGGNLLIVCEPGKQDVMNPLLSELGIAMEAGTLLSRNKSEVPTVIPATLTKAAGNLSQGAAGLYHARSKVILSGASALDISGAQAKGFHAEPLLITAGDQQWLRTAPVVNDSAMVEFDEVPGDKKGPFTAVVSLEKKTGKKQQRIIVSADADFMSNISLQAYKQYNGPFTYGMFKWFSEDAFPVELPYKTPKDDKINLSEAGLSRLKVGLVWILPSLLVGLSSILLIRRKRR